MASGNVLIQKYKSLVPERVKCQEQRLKADENIIDTDLVDAAKNENTYGDLYWNELFIHQLLL